MKLFTRTVLFWNGKNYNVSITQLMCKFSVRALALVPAALQEISTVG